MMEQQLTQTIEQNAVATTTEEENKEEAGLLATTEETQPVDNNTKPVEENNTTTVTVPTSSPPKAAAGSTTIPDEDDRVFKEYKNDREFIMGCAADLVGKLKDAEINLSLNSKIAQFFLVAKPAEHIKFILDEIRGIEDGIVGIEFDNMIMAVDFDKEDTKEIVIEADGEDFIQFKEIELQHLYFENIPRCEPTQYWLSVNYLRFVDSNGKTYEIGVKKPEGTIEEHEYKGPDTATMDDEYKDKYGDKYNKYKVIYAESTIEKGNLMLTGFMFSRGGLVGLQVVDKVNDENNKIDEKDLLDIYKMSDHQGIYEVANDYHVWNEALKVTLLSRKIFWGHLVGMENEKIFNIFVNLFEDTFWYDDIRYSILPKFFQLIEQCVDGDFATIHSILAMQRFLDHFIQTEMVSNGICNEEKGTLMFKKLKRTGRAFGEFGAKKRRMYLPHLVKARYIWSELCEVIKKINYLLYYAPSPDIFTNTYLNPTRSHYATLASTFIAQCLLFTLVVSSIEFSEVGEESISVLVSILMATIVLSLVWKQTSNMFAFLRVFPDSWKSPFILFGMFINIILAISLIPVNVLILASTPDQLDLVLNALAVLFILEVDDQVVDGEDIESVYLAHFQKMIIDRLEDKDNFDMRYIEKFVNSQGAKQTHKVDVDTCHIIWDGKE